MLSAVYAVVVCLCVCVSVTLRYCIKTAKRRITQIMPHDSHNEPPHANSPGVATVLSHAACASMSTTTTTTRDRGDRYGPMEWAQKPIEIEIKPNTNWSNFTTTLISLLHGTAATVLTATGLVNGQPRSIFNPHRNNVPLLITIKICHSWLCPGLLLLCKILWKSVHGRLTGKQKIK